MFEKHIMKLSKNATDQDFFFFLNSPSEVFISSSQGF